MTAFPDKRVVLGTAWYNTSGIIGPRGNVLVRFCWLLEWKTNASKIIVFSAEVILFLVYSNGRNTPYGKLHIITSRTKLILFGYYYVWLKLAFTTILLVRDRQTTSTHSSTRKRLRDERHKNTPRSIGQLEKRTTFRATDVIKRWTSATMPTTRRPTGVARSPQRT